MPGMLSLARLRPKSPAPVSLRAQGESKITLGRKQQLRKIGLVLHSGCQDVVDQLILTLGK